MGHSSWTLIEKRKDHGLLREYRHLVDRERWTTSSFFFSLFIRADNDDDDDDVGDFMDKQTNTYDYMYVVGFPLTCKNNYNLLEAREARDEIIL